MPGAAYSVPSPIPITIELAGLFSSTALPAANVPFFTPPPGWVASVRLVEVIFTTAPTGGANQWLLVQIGDGTTVNKFAQVQCGETTHAPGVGVTYLAYQQPGAAGVNVAGVAGGTDKGASQSGLTGRNPANAPSAGVSGPFLFAPSGTFAGTTGLFLTTTWAGSPTGAGAFNVIVYLELSDVG